MSNKSFYVYILSNYKDSVFYIGVTNNLVRRVWEHKQKIVKGFTERYQINKLIYYEEFKDAESAITREKQLKGGSRQKKVKQVLSTNPLFKDLYETII